MSVTSYSKAELLRFRSVPQTAPEEMLCGNGVINYARPVLKREVREAIEVELESGIDATFELE